MNLGRAMGIGANKCMSSAIYFAQTYHVAMQQSTCISVNGILRPFIYIVNNLGNTIQPITGFTIHRY